MNGQVDGLCVLVFEEGVEYFEVYYDWVGVLV